MNQDSWEMSRIEAKSGDYVISKFNPLLKILSLFIGKFSLNKYYLPSTIKSEGPQMQISEITHDRPLWDDSCRTSFHWTNSLHPTYDHQHLHSIQSRRFNQWVRMALKVNGHSKVDHLEWFLISGPSNYVLKIYYFRLNFWFSAEKSSNRKVLIRTGKIRLRTRLGQRVFTQLRWLVRSSTSGHRVVLM